MQGTLYFMSVEVDLGGYLFSSDADTPRVEFHRDPAAGIIRGLGSSLLLRNPPLRFATTR